MSFCIVFRPTIIPKRNCVEGILQKFSFKQVPGNLLKCIILLRVRLQNLIFNSLKG